jgi:hypothetical protein
MKSRTWKIAAVILAFLIAITFGINQSFSSYSNHYFTTHYGSNGTVIIVVVESSLLVHGKITVNYEGQEAGIPIVILPNGTQYTVNSKLKLNFGFGLAPASGGNSVYGGPANISVSPSHPIYVNAVYNVPYKILRSVIDTYNGSGLNCYAIFVYNYSMVFVSVVGGF